MRLMHRKILAFFLLLSSMICYGLGLYYPLVRTQTRLLGFTLRTETVRLSDSIALFWNSKEITLAIIIFAFTILLPLVKYLELSARFFLPGPWERHFSWLRTIDKWSMLDVFIVALLLLNFKLNSAIIVMQLMQGTTWLAASIILRMASVHALDYYLSGRKNKQGATAASVSDGSHI